MATSKLPNDLVSRKRISELVRNTPGVVVNNINKRNFHSCVQFGGHGRREVYGDSVFVSYEVYWFLKKLILPARIALLFQGYEVRDIGVAVVEVRNIYWTGGNEEYPRLDFNHPTAMQEIHGCPNFWGAFILAIAKVPPDTKIMADKDPQFAIFAELVKTWAIA